MVATFYFSSAHGALIHCYLGVPTTFISDLGVGLRLSILICDIYTDSDTGIATDAGAAAGPATDTAVARVDGLRWHVRHAAVAEQPKTKQPSARHT